MSDEEDHPQYIKVAELAAELGRSGASFNRALKKQGIDLIRFTDERNSPYYISVENAEKVRETINNPLIHRNADIDSLPRNPGVYLVEVPTYENGRRFKVGWSDDIQDRFASYRTVLPDLRVLRFWPTAYKHLERTALMVAERNGRRIHTELFDFQNPETALENLDALFRLVGIEPRLPTADEGLPVEDMTTDDLDEDDTEA